MSMRLLPQLAQHTALEHCCILSYILVLVVMQRGFDLASLLSLQQPWVCLQGHVGRAFSGTQPPSTYRGWVMRIACAGCFTESSICAYTDAHATIVIYLIRLCLASCPPDLGHGRQINRGTPKRGWRPAATQPGQQGPARGRPPHPSRCAAPPSAPQRSTHAAWPGRPRCATTRAGCQSRPAPGSAATASASPSLPPTAPAAQGCLSDMQNAG